MTVAQLAAVLHLQGVPFVSLDAYGIGTTAQAIGTWPGPRTQTASLGITPPRTRQHLRAAPLSGAGRAHHTPETL